MEWKNKDRSQCTMYFQNLQPNEMDSQSVDILPIETGNIGGTYLTDLLLAIVGCRWY